MDSLKEAEAKAITLFKKAKENNYFEAGIDEKELNVMLYKLAYEMYGIKKYWHKRIVRIGTNTLLPYFENPPNIALKEDDILFLDFGPIFEDWEADVGRTYVIGSDMRKHKLTRDIEKVWCEGKQYFLEDRNITGRDMYHWVMSMAKKYGWDFTAEMAGHIIGKFPHERLEKENKENYIHPENYNKLRAKDKKGDEKAWILEVHFVDLQRRYGGFYEQLLY